MYKLHIIIIILYALIRWGNKEWKRGRGDRMCFDESSRSGLDNTSNVAAGYDSTAAAEAATAAAPRRYNIIYMRLVYNNNNIMRLQYTRRRPPSRSSRCSVAPLPWYSRRPPDVALDTSEKLLSSSSPTTPQH